VGHSKVFVHILMLLLFTSSAFAQDGFNNAVVLDFIAGPAREKNIVVATLVEDIFEALIDGEPSRIMITDRGEVLLFTGTELYMAMLIRPVGEEDGRVLMCHIEERALNHRAQGIFYDTGLIANDDIINDNFDFLETTDPEHALTELLNEIRLPARESRGVKRERDDDEDACDEATKSKRPKIDSEQTLRPNVAELARMLVLGSAKGSTNT